MIPYCWSPELSPLSKCPAYHRTHRDDRDSYSDRDSQQGSSTAPSWCTRATWHTQSVAVAASVSRFSPGLSPSASRGSPWVFSTPAQRSHGPPATLKMVIKRPYATSCRLPSLPKFPVIPAFNRGYALFQTHSALFHAKPSNSVLYYPGMPLWGKYLRKEWKLWRFSVV